MLTWASANSCCPIAALKWVKVAVISALTPEINPSLYIMPKPFKQSRSPCSTPRSNQALPSQDQLSRPRLGVTSASDMRQLPHHDSLSFACVWFWWVCEQYLQLLVPTVVIGVFPCPNYEYVDAKKSIIDQQVAALKLLRSQILWYVYEQNWNWLHGYIGRLQWVERVNNKFPVSDIRLIELLTNEGEIENVSSWVDRCKVLLARGSPNSVFAGYGTDNLKGPKLPPGSPIINCNVVAMKVLYCGLLFQTWHAGISPILNILPGT